MKHKKVILGSITISFFALILLLAFVLRGNFFRYNDINSMISEPQAIDILIEGTWKIETIISLSNEEDNTTTESKLYITDKMVSFEDRSTKQPEFRFKYVNFKNYLLSKGIVSDKISVNSDNIKVVTVSDIDGYYQEFILIDETHIGMIYDKRYYLFELESKTVSLTADDISNQISNKNFENNDTAFMIGLKSIGNKNINYETILIRKNYKEPISFNRINGLLINDYNRFFLVNYKPDIGIYYTEDYINESEKKILQISNPVINFLSNSFISFEIYSEDNFKKNYEIHSLKNLSDNKKLSVTDIAGKFGEKLYYDNMKKLGYSINNTNLIELDNVGIKRTNSRWTFKSIFSGYYADNLISTESDLDLIPKMYIFENKAVNYSRTSLKNKAENLIDYFVSPDENMLIILTNSEIVVYSIENGNISTLPVATLNLNERKDVVSFQFLNSNSSELTYNEFQKVSKVD